MVVFRLVTKLEQSLMVGKWLKDKIDQAGNRGFTMIEVTIVLFLAGVVFVIVFFAVIQLQEASRTNQRTRDLSRLVTEVIGYASANSNVPPQDQSEIDDFTANYINEFTLRDPDTNSDYEIFFNNTPPSSGQTGVVHYALGSQCNGDSLGPADNAIRDFALIMRSRSGNITICQDNR